MTDYGYERIPPSEHEGARRIEYLEKIAKSRGTHIPEYPFRAGYIQKDYCEDYFFCNDDTEDKCTQGFRVTEELSKQLSEAEKLYGKIPYWHFYDSFIHKWIDDNGGLQPLSDLKALLFNRGITKQEELNNLSLWDIESIIRLRVKEKKQLAAIEQPDSDCAKVKRLIQLIENFLSRYFEIEEQIRKETYLKSFFDENSKPLHLPDSCLKNINDAIEAARGVLYIKGNWGTNNIRETLDQLSSLIFDIAGELDHISGVLWLAPNLEDALASKIENPNNSKDPWDSGFEDNSRIQRLIEPRKQRERKQKAALIAEILHGLELRKLAGLEQQSMQEKKNDITKAVDDSRLRELPEIGQPSRYQKEDKGSLQNTQVSKIDETEDLLTKDQKALFVKIRQRIYSNPQQYKPAGTLIDKYTLGDSYKARKLSELNKTVEIFGYKERSKDDFDAEFNEIVNAPETPYLDRVRELWESLLCRYSMTQFLGNSELLAAQIITWLATDPETEHSNLKITGLEKWPWELWGTKLTEEDKLLYGFGRFVLSRELFHRKEIPGFKQKVFEILELSLQVDTDKLGLRDLAAKDQQAIPLKSQIGFTALDNANGQWKMTGQDGFNQTVNKLIDVAVHTRELIGWCIGSVPQMTLYGLHPIDALECFEAKCMVFKNIEIPKEWPINPNAVQCFRFTDRSALEVLIRVLHFFYNTHLVLRTTAFGVYLHSKPVKTPLDEQISRYRSLFVAELKKQLAIEHFVQFKDGFDRLLYQFEAEMNTFIEANKANPKDRGWDTKESEHNICGHKSSINTGKKNPSLIDSITADLFDWEKPFTSQQIKEIENKIAPLAQNLEELAAFIENADDFIKEENSDWCQSTSDDLKVSDAFHSGFSEDAVSLILSSVLSTKKLRAEIEKLMQPEEAKIFYQQLQVGLHLVVSEKGAYLNVPYEPIPPDRHNAAAKQIAQLLRLKAGDAAKKRQVPISLKDSHLKILIAYKNTYPKIPTYDDLGRATGFTRTTISDALRILESKGLLASVGNKKRCITDGGLKLAENHLSKSKKN